ncbi:hypothetical protein CAPI_07045 [Corynebacterium capitovis DSM 44611]|uniref:hypothetical protein n=1 Tax=Corynebacterium capitovis TaxID=131081 RepID=UPI0003610D97|nr:hypothetical protein [Corynebacterium capitovis]WKD57949.1 hypothetical protein CAPI_07045 [Corynebacterium capitovis DSM 44611]
MKTLSSRTVASAGFSAVVALGLAACSPPHQVDSEQKVDTAKTQNPDSLAGSASTTKATSTNVAEASATRKSADATATLAPGTVPAYENCDGVAEQRPTRLALSCKDQDDFMENISWRSWGESLAAGVGTRVTVDPDRREEDATIVLSSPQIVDGELRFTVVTVDGETINPDSAQR